MFTGIVQGLQRVVWVRDRDGVRRLRVDLTGLGADVADGASIAVNGTCLTVAAHGADWAEFDVIPESLTVTNLADVRPGDAVNVERSARLLDEIGGHRVSGHISGPGIVRSIAASGGDYRMWIAVDRSLMPYLLHKGFVAVNGASLTISAVDRPVDRFQISLIPETLARTTFGTTHAGQVLNIEVDPSTQAVVDTVRAMLADPALRAGLFDAAGVRTDGSPA